MIGVDTDILVRFITQDDPVLAKTAETFLTTRSAQDPAHVSAVTLAEVAWVLKRVYRVSNSEILAIVEDLLSASHVVVQHAGSAHAAIARCKAANAEFADAFIAAINAEAGCVETVTLDKDAAKRAGTRHLT